MKSNMVSIFSLTAIFLTLSGSGCASTGDNPRVRIYEEKQYIQFSHLQNTVQNADPTKAQATKMACRKCKTVLYYPYVSPFAPRWYFERREQMRNDWAGETRANQSPQYRHHCPGCKSTIKVTGHWLTRRKESISHTCNTFEEEPSSCCASLPAASTTKNIKKEQESP